MIWSWMKFTFFCFFDKQKSNRLKSQKGYTKYTRSLQVCFEAKKQEDPPFIGSLTNS